MTTLCVPAQPAESGELIREPAGLDSLLAQENPESFVQLPLVRPSLADVRSDSLSVDKIRLA